MREAKYEELERLAKYRNFLRENPKLKFLFLELTNKCNLSCIHCGSSCGPDNDSPELSFETVRQVLDDVAEKYNSKGILLCLTGGEPLLNKDIFKIAEYASSLGFYWGMTTNATLITKDIAHKLRICNMSTVTVSIDGLENDHNQLRSNPYAFSSAMNGIKNLQDEGFDVQVTTVISKINIQSLDDIYRLLIKKNIKSWRVINIEPIGRALNNSELFLDENDYLYLLNYIRDKRETSSNIMEVTFGCSHYLGQKWELKTRKYYFLCSSGIYVGSILCNGDIFSCLDIDRRPELIQGNIYKDKFTDIWEKRFEAFREDRTEKSKECSKCSDRFVCGGDSTHTWDFQQNEPRICLKKIMSQDKEGDN